jgi:hypothetical protein
MSASGGMVAFDAGVRIVRCYSYLTRSVVQIGVAAIVAVADDGLVDRLVITASDPDTRPYEEELARHYSRLYAVCVFDGPPARICGRNIGVVKTGRPVEGWLCAAAGPYAVCVDFELDGETVKRAIKLNSIAHRYAYDAAKASFRYELLKRRCVVAEGVHPVPELSYYSK